VTAKKCEALSRAGTEARKREFQRHTFGHVIAHSAIRAHGARRQRAFSHSHARRAGYKFERSTRRNVGGIGVDSHNLCNPGLGVGGRAEGGRNPHHGAGNSAGVPTPAVPPLHPAYHHRVAARPVRLKMSQGGGVPGQGSGLKIYRI
jgi:hypothetical protein